MNRPYPYILVLAMVTVALATQAHGKEQGGGPGNAQRQQRDRATRPQPAGEARISGRVVTADTGRPVRRARIMIDAAELPGGRATLTDDQGLFEIPGLPAGRYSVNVSKSGFVTLSYGQRRPQQPGTPIQLAAGQHLASVDFKLPRGGVIAGHVVDDAGEPLAGANVAAMRYAYAQGARQLVPAGNTSTDDQGAFRIWGLNPGSYYVTATTRNLEGMVGALMAGATPEATAMIEQAAARFGGQAGGPFGGRGGGPGGRGGVAAMGFGPTAGTTPDGDAAQQAVYTPTYYPG
ncbi:MAG: carboxypeptidase-like regulatory domain-containing protein, partial [Vicinamibacterales bacterium]